MLPVARGTEASGLEWLEARVRGLGTGVGLLALGVVGVLVEVEVGRVLVLLSAL